MIATVVPTIESTPTAWQEAKATEPALFEAIGDPAATRLTVAQGAIRDA